jgi:hypothetical protein
MLAFLIAIPTVYFARPAKREAFITERGSGCRRSAVGTNRLIPTLVETSHALSYGAIAW